MSLRRYAPLKPSRGTVWPPEVRRAIEARDRGCVANRAGIPGDCSGSLEIDHVRASHGIGMKSRSTEDNGVVLCGSHHRVKTENGKLIRPLLLRYLEVMAGACGHVEPMFGCPGPCNRADPLTLREIAS